MLKAGATKVSDWVRLVMISNQYFSTAVVPNQVDVGKIRHKPDVKAGKELVQLATEIWHDLPEEKSTNSRRHRRYWACSWEPARSRFQSRLDDVENFFHSAVALAFSPPIPVPAPPALLLILTGILDLIGSNKRRNAA